MNTCGLFQKCEEDYTKIEGYRCIGKYQDIQQQNLIWEYYSNKLVLHIARISRGATRGGKGRSKTPRYQNQ